MNWFLAALAPLLSTILIWIGGPAWVQAGYHLLCVAAIAYQWKRIKPLLAWTPGSGLWSSVLSLVIVSGMIVFAQIWDPRVLRPSFTAMIFPQGYHSGVFGIIAAFTFLIHTPLEELYWRGAAVDEARGFHAAVWGSAFFFYWNHAGPLFAFAGTRGLWLSLPTAFAGAVWVLATLRTKSIWPALISHWAAEVVILYGIFSYLRP